MADAPTAHLRGPVSIRLERTALNRDTRRAESITPVIVLTAFTPAGVARTVHLSPRALAALVRQAGTVLESMEDSRG